MQALLTQDVASFESEFFTLTEEVGSYLEAGADGVILALRSPFDIAALDDVATSVLPAFRDRVSAV